MRNVGRWRRKLSLLRFWNTLQLLFFHMKTMRPRSFTTFALPLATASVLAAGSRRCRPDAIGLGRAKMPGEFVE